VICCALGFGDVVEYVVRMNPDISILTVLIRTIEGDHKSCCTRMKIGGLASRLKDIEYMDLYTSMYRQTIILAHFIAKNHPV
jgi:hypothetical protein